VSQHPAPTSHGAALPDFGAAPVRPGEELDLEALAPYLLREIPGAAGPLSVRQFPGGYSNLTYLLRLGERELVLRRPPFGNRVKTAHDMGREFRVLSLLHPLYPLAPEPFVYCADEAVIGAPFYVMERRRGVVLHPGVMGALRPDEETARRLSEAFLDHLAGLHCLDLAATGLGELGRPEGYGRRQVEGWTERYHRSATGPRPEIEEILAWLAAHLPAEGAGTSDTGTSDTGKGDTGKGRAALIHNDYKLDNLVLDPAELSRIVGVLDWEMATVGDPLFDLGTSLAYWVEAGEEGGLAATGLVAPAFPGTLRRRDLAERYGERTGTDPSGILYHYLFGLAKIAVIVQQIYARYLAGHSRDPRFAGLGEVVTLLGRRAAEALSREEI